MADDRPGIESAEPFTDDELTALALAADANAPVSDDAVAIWELLGPGPQSPLPSWYMPAPMGTRRLRGWRGRLVRCSVYSVIASFVVINAYGLCNTYGQLHF
jgi:hypothetical protein